MTKSCLRHLLGALLPVLIASSPILAEPLNVAPGSDPGGTAIAVITPPFHLVDSDVSHKLARDGEGVAIGWDFSKRPKSSEGGSAIQDTAAAPEIVRTLAGRQNIRIVSAFIDRLRPASWAQAVAFVAQTPARIVVVPFATAAENDWVAFRAAAEHFPNLLFILPAQSTDKVDKGETATGDGLAYPAAFHLANVLSVSTRSLADTDVVLTTPSPATTDAALALAVNTLLFCPSTHETTQPPMSKLEAMAKFGSLNTSLRRKAPTLGPPPITPCTEAYN